MLQGWGPGRVLYVNLFFFEVGKLRVPVVPVRVCFVWQPLPLTLLFCLAATGTATLKYSKLTGALQDDHEFA